MTIIINQHVVNTLTESRELIKTFTYETFTITPDKGKYLRNIRNGQIIEGSVSVDAQVKINNFEEITDNK